MFNQEVFNSGFYWGGYVFNVLILYYVLKKDSPEQLSPLEDFVCLIASMFFSLFWPIYFFILCLIFIPLKIMFYSSGLWNFIVSLFYHILDFEYRPPKEPAK